MGLDKDNKFSSASEETHFVFRYVNDFLVKKEMVLDMEPMIFILLSQKLIFIIVNLLWWDFSLSSFRWKRRHMPPRPMLLSHSPNLQLKEAKVFCTQPGLIILKPAL